MEGLDVDDVGVAFRPPFDRVFPLVAQSLVETWGLEAVRRDNDLLAPASDSFSFCSAKQRSAKTLSSVPLVHPDV